MTPGLPTTGPHVFVGSLVEDEVTVDGESGRHLQAVLRVRMGESLSLADGSGTVAQAKIVAIDRSGVVVAAILERFDIPVTTPTVTVVQALPKGRKMEEVIQRLTEVGVDRLRPVITARTIRQVDGKADRVLDRWQAIAIAAARQSRRPRPLLIDTIAPWPVTGVTGVVLHEQATMPLSAVVEPVLATSPPEVTLAIGPEGGFAPHEVEVAGLVPAALGPTILRAETAPVVAASVLLHRLGRLG